MNKQEIYQWLDARQIHYGITEHEAVFNIEDLAKVKFPHPEDIAKNLFVRDDKKRNYYLITVRRDKHVALKDFRRTYGTRPLSFASEDDLRSILQLAPGSVTPLGLLNDAACAVQFYLDCSFMEPPGRIGIHPNENTATVWMQSQDLLDILRVHGTRTHIVSL